MLLLARVSETDFDWDKMDTYYNYYVYVEQLTTGRRECLKEWELDVFLRNFYPISVRSWTFRFFNCFVEPLPKYSDYSLSTITCMPADKCVVRVSSNRPGEGWSAWIFWGLFPQLVSFIAGFVNILPEACDCASGGGGGFPQTSQASSWSY